MSQGDRFPDSHVNTSEQGISTATAVFGALVVI